MKTTVDLDDRLLTRAKDEARRRKTTLRRLIEDGLRVELSRRSIERKRYRMKDVSVGGPGGLQPGIDLSNWDQMLEIMYEGRGA
jgi:hypothetical protein